MIDFRLQNPNNSIVFITKPFPSYHEVDGLRLDTFDFQKCVEYDQTMQERMKSLRIPFVHIEEENLIDRIRFVLKEISNRWKDVNPASEINCQRVFS